LGARIAALPRNHSSATCAEAKTCFYSVTEGERFIVEPLGRAWVLAGFSGHGFKFGAVIGEAIVKALSGGRSVETVTDWAAGRV
jgi:glycine/D-amino acid oxidase-like deaminating enzyme